MARFWIFMILMFAWNSFAFEPKVMEGRKDGASCCEKLDNNTFSTDCENTLLWAGENEKYAYSPNFPNRFPVQKKCVWAIYTKAGKRVRLEFRDFYLIGPGDDGLCHSQGVVVKSPLSKLEMGPHCGNAGLPTIISAGNYLVVELISNIPMTTENFRGFKMAFSESVETPSPELRPPNWENNQDFVADIPSKIKPFSPATPKKPTKTSTRKPSRFRPGRRPGSLSPAKGYYRGNVPRNPNYRDTNILPPPKAFPRPPHEEKESSTLSSEAIVGIAVGGMVVVGLILLLIIKLALGMKARRENLNRGQKKNENISKSNGTETDKKPPESTNSPQVHDSSSSAGYYVYFYEDDKQQKKKHETLHKTRTLTHRSKVNEKTNMRQQGVRDKTRHGKSPVSQQSGAVVPSKRRPKSSRDTKPEKRTERVHQHSKRKRSTQIKDKNKKHGDEEDKTSTKRKTDRCHAKPRSKLPRERSAKRRPRPDK